MEDNQSFRLEEYKSLRKEVELYLTESRSQERYTLVAVGAIWAWLILNRIDDLLLWWVPIILTLAVSIRMAAILKHFANINEYLKTVEDEFKVIGWEHKKKGWTLGGAYIVLSVLLLLLAIIAMIHRGDLIKCPLIVCPK
jgi:hypothetical protein